MGSFISQFPLYREEPRHLLVAPSATSYASHCTSLNVVMELGITKLGAQSRSLLPAPSFSYYYFYSLLSPSFPLLFNRAQDRGGLSPPPSAASTLSVCNTISRVSQTSQHSVIFKSFKSDLLRSTSRRLVHFDISSPCKMQ
jgi:hypothetical protein